MASDKTAPALHPNSPHWIGQLISMRLAANHNAQIFSPETAPLVLMDGVTTTTGGVTTTLSSIGELSYVPMISCMQQASSPILQEIVVRVRRQGWNGSFHFHFCYHLMMCYHLHIRIFGP